MINRIFNNIWLKHNMSEVLNRKRQLHLELQLKLHGINYISGRSELNAIKRSLITSAPTSNERIVHRVHYGIINSDKSSSDIPLYA